MSPAKRKSLKPEPGDTEVERLLTAGPWFESGPRANKSNDLVTSHPERAGLQPGYRQSSQRSPSPPAFAVKLVLSVAATLEGQPMSPIRRTMLLSLATLMIASGVWLLYEEFTVATIIYGKGVFAGGVLVFVGLAVVWEDYIAPLLRRKFS